MSQKVLASYFSDKIGNRDNRLDDGGYYYAELSMKKRNYHLSLIQK